MKLSVLLAQFLYQHKTLNLPGLGTFTIDESVPVPEPGDKNYAEFLQQIRFTQKNVQQPDDELIEFIRANTGKIRPLAISDLESLLDDGKLLLNISKPFHLDGIGTLQKDKLGAYHFTTGEELAFEKLEPYIAGKPTETSTRKKSVFQEEGNPSARRNTRMIFIISLTVVAVVAIIWGGYTLYDTKTGAPDTGTQKEPIAAESTMVLSPDSSTASAAARDTLSDHAAPASGNAVNAIPADSYKFVILYTHSKHHAMRRYDQLKGLPLKMYTNPDSTEFKLYFVLPATPADTLRIKDSLADWFAYKNVLIEK